MLITSRPLKVVFMGTPGFSIPVLSSLLNAGHDLIGVYTKPDRPVGRGKQNAPSQVKHYAMERGLPIYQPPSLKGNTRASQELATLSPDIIVVAAYGLFLPVATLQLPRLGCLNIHPSILPRYRGPSPVATAILNGETNTGVTIMLIDEGMDSGPILSQRLTSIEPDETTEALTKRLFAIGSMLLEEILPQWIRGQLEAHPQDHSQSTVTRRLSKEDGEIDWDLPAVLIARQIRACSPWPGSFTLWAGQSFKIIEASALDSTIDSSPQGQIGHVIPLPEGRLGITTGDGILEVKQVQIEGRRALNIQNFLLGHRDFLGSTVGS